MTVLVTDTDGHIGSVMRPYLMGRGFDVTGLDTGYLERGGFLITGKFKIWD